MKIVYEVSVSTCFDFEEEIENEVFSNYEEAKLYYEKECEKAMNCAKEDLGLDYAIIDKGETSLSIYEPGRASEWEYSVMLNKKVVNNKKLGRKLLKTN